MPDRPLPHQVILSPVPEAPMQPGAWRLPIIGGRLAGSWAEISRRDPCPRFENVVAPPRPTRYTPDPTEDFGPVQTEVYELTRWHQPLVDGEAVRWCFALKQVRETAYTEANPQIDLEIRRLARRFVPTPLNPQERAHGQEEPAEGQPPQRAVGYFGDEAEQPPAHPGGSRANP